jgi:hypothetical protein
MKNKFVKHLSIISIFYLALFTVPAFGGHEAPDQVIPKLLEFLNRPIAPVHS